MEDIKSLHDSDILSYEDEGFFERITDNTSYSAFSSVTFKQISPLSIGVEEGTIQLEGCSHPFHDYLLPFFARNLYLKQVYEDIIKTSKGKRRKQVRSLLKVLQSVNEKRRK